MVINPFELPKDLLHEVIIRTIELDNLSNQIIKVSFGLDLKWGGENGSILLNLNEINRFKNFFLDKLGSSSRAKLLYELVKDVIENNKKELKPCEEFEKKIIDFYKIRNIFAHNLYPKGLDGYTKLDSSIPYWIELNKQHKELHEELKNFLNQLLSNSISEIKTNKD